MKDYGKIEKIQRVLRIERQCKGVQETYKVGDVVWINYSLPTDTRWSFLAEVESNGGCTGRITSIDSDDKGETVITVDCSTLYASRVVTVQESGIVDIGLAKKDAIECMQGEGARYL